MTHDPPGALRRLSELDALRGLGALLVVNFHFTTRYGELFPDAHHLPVLIGGGNYRVLLFFAISGFAIFFSMSRLESAADFAVGRLVRLFPTYWAAMALTLVIEHAAHVTQLYVPVEAALVNLTMLQGFFFIPDVDGAYWTLAVELAFYASMLVLWMATGLRNVERLIAGWLAVKLGYELFWQDMPERIMMLMVLDYVCFFMIGMLFWRVWKGQRSLVEQAPYLAAVLLTIAITEPCDILLVAIVIVAAFWAMVAGHLRWLCIAPLVWVGRISYSLYLVHQNIGYSIMLRADGAGLSPWTGYAMAMVAAFGLAILINRFVERPATRFLLAWWNANKPARTGPVIPAG